mmetsp:Transcript_6500/g.14184  ORF Transcript_6500/g.14184 Transcript_6500/m.14184 type:complete len:735 (-) Transcript_6500:397-2601(-)
MHCLQQLPTRAQFPMLLFLTSAAHHAIIVSGSDILSNDHHQVDVAQRTVNAEHIWQPVTSTGRPKLVVAHNMRQLQNSVPASCLPEDPALLDGCAPDSPGQAKPTTDPRIVGGSSVTKRQYGFMTRLVFTFVLPDNSVFTTTCGGSLISAHTVLTAAHCAVRAIFFQFQSISITATSVEVQLGVHNINDIPTDECVRVYTSTSLTVHPDFRATSAGGYEADLVVVHVDEAVDPLFEPIPLNGPNINLDGSDTAPGDFVAAAGWGRTDEIGLPSDVLQGVSIRVLRCDAYDGGIHPRVEELICAGCIGGGADACAGDSGGPLFIDPVQTGGSGRPTLVGVSSFGVGCARPDFPGAFQRVDFFQQWIECTADLPQCPSPPSVPSPPAAPSPVEPPSQVFSSPPLLVSPPASTPPARATSSPPPSIVPASAHARKDPHLWLAHGGRADWRGKHGAIYNLLSASNLSFSARISEVDLRMGPRRLVHGTCMSAAYWTIRTSPSGAYVHIEYNVSSLREKNYATVQVSNAVLNESLTQRPSTHSLHLAPQIEAVLASASVPYRLTANRQFVLENVAMRLSSARELIVENGKWRTAAKMSSSPYAALNPHKRMLDVFVTPLYDVDADAVAPHGLVGQSFDGDGLAVDGKRDERLTLGEDEEVTTEAQAEGAIEGAVSDYELPHKFTTAFRYSRFEATAAPRRNVTALQGRKRQASREQHAQVTAANFGMAYAEQEERSASR